MDERDMEKRKNPSLLPLVFEPLPLGAIKPMGWLGEQLQTMADGLAGHEYDFYKIVRENPWLGGTHDYSDLNEALPYWFNGLVPLAYQTEDPRLLHQVHEVSQYILEHQQEDGWLGPETDLAWRNFWATTPVFLGLAQLAEPQAGTEMADKIIGAMYKFVDLMHSMLSDDLQGLVAKEGDKFNEQWGRSRAADMILVLQWLYEKHPRDDGSKLLDCMNFFKEGAFDWSWWFSEENYIKVDLDTIPSEITEKLYHFEHVVNAGQGLKSGAVIRRFTHDDNLRESSRRGVNWTFLYHGTPSGAIIGDERLSGLSPVRGTELCSVVETMYSLSYLYQSIGDRGFADRCELAAFNALPVMLTPDWWAHQYVAQTNQPVSHELKTTPFYNVNGFGQTFGLEPNYPCCTVNHPQGYPKFVSNMFVRTGYTGIAHALLGPAEVRTTTKSGVKVHIKCETDYPFSNVLYYKIETDSPFIFGFRVPTWVNTRGSSISFDGARSNGVRADRSTGMQQINIRPGNHVVIVSFATDIRVEPRANDTVAIHHGSLLYSIPIGVKVDSKPTDYEGAPEKMREYTMKPTSKWALAIDPSSLTFNGPSADTPSNSGLPNPVWAEDGMLSTITAKVCEIKWELTDPGDQGYCPNPPKKDERDCIGEPFEVKMVPYGTARLHMAELPTIKLT
ncbi:hypothetical protein FQN53_006457 [Emmonsiellopsis sp. PD_33]|nr:hypothetical protein FQN53_006457 [Emmonsiellopsis sp. PD_33]